MKFLTIIAPGQHSPAKFQIIIWRILTFQVDMLSHRTTSSSGGDTTATVGSNKSPVADLLHKSSSSATYIPNWSDIFPPPPEGPPPPTESPGNSPRAARRRQQVCDLGKLSSSLVLSESMM